MDGRKVISKLLQKQAMKYQAVKKHILSLLAGHPSGLTVSAIVDDVSRTFILPLEDARKYVSELKSQWVVKQRGSRLYLANPNPGEVSRRYLVVWSFMRDFPHNERLKLYKRLRRAMGKIVEGGGKAEWIQRGVLLITSSEEVEDIFLSVFQEAYPFADRVRVNIFRVV